MSQNFRYSVWVSGASVVGVQLYVCPAAYNNNSFPPSPISSIFSDLAGASPITQPITIGTAGQFTFCAPAGPYNLVIVQSGQIKVVVYNQKIDQSSSFSVTSFDGTLQVVGSSGSSGVGVASFSDIVGQISSSQSTAAVVDLTAQSAAITTTTLYAVPTSGLYQVSFYAKVTTAAGVSSVLGGTNGFQIGYTDFTDNTTPLVTVADLFANALNGNTTTTVDSGICIIAAKTGTNITYAFDYMSVGTAMQYKLNLRVVAL